MSLRGEPLILLEVRVEGMRVLLVPLHHEQLASTSLNQPLDVHLYLFYVFEDAELVDPVLAQLFTAVLGGHTHGPVEMVLHHKVLKLLELQRKTRVKVGSVLLQKLVQTVLLDLSPTFVLARLIGAQKLLNQVLGGVGTSVGHKADTL